MVLEGTNKMTYATLTWESESEREREREWGFWGVSERECMTSVVLPSTIRVSQSFLSLLLGLVYCAGEGGQRQLPFSQYSKILSFSLGKTHQAFFKFRILIPGFFSSIFFARCSGNASQRWAFFFLVNF